MKRLFLIRHAKSSWSDPTLDDFDRPLNKRGKRDAPEMADRLAALDIVPDLMISSPAKRARKTAVQMAKATGYDRNSIRFDEDLYLGSLSYHLHVIENALLKSDTLFLVGHNHTITELAGYLSGTYIDNIPTCGIAAIEFTGHVHEMIQAGGGKLLFFDFPKNKS